MTSEQSGVLFIVNSLRFGGAEKHVISLLNHLNENQFRLSLAYLKPEQNLLPEIKTSRLEAVFCSNVSKKIDLRAARELARVIDTAKIDVLVCTNTYSMFYGLLAKVFSKRKPKVMEVFHTTLLQGRKDRLQMAFYWPFFWQCAKLVYVCENQRRYWRSKGLRAKGDAVVYNGIDTDYFSATYTPGEKQQIRQSYGFATNDYLIGICAALRTEKAHGHLLQAVARLREAGIPAKCLIIGEGVERSSIERRIVELGLEQQVAITGFQADVRPFVATCDVMALVSDSETFSISALEAMAIGRPMVMSRIGGADEQVQHGENGYLYPAGDIDALTLCLSQLAEPHLRQRMGDKAREVVTSRFSMQPMVQAFELLLKQLLNKA